MSRERINELRKTLLDAFMAEDDDAYAKAVYEMESLIGVAHGDRNPKANWLLCLTDDDKANWRQKVDATKKRKMKVDIEEIDGGMTWTVKY